MEGSVLNRLIESWAQALELPAWGLALPLLMAALVLAHFFLALVFRKLTKAADKTRVDWDDAVIYAVKTPARVLVWILGLSLTLDHPLFWPAADSAPQEEGASDFGLLSSELLTNLRLAAIVLMLGWLLLRLIRSLEKQYSSHVDDRSSLDRATLSALSRLARIVVWIAVTLVLMDQFGIAISGLLAAGGIGGLALAFAAKDILANLFGGLNIFLNRPFTEGDWVRSPDKHIEGVVEHIGWRQTTIRQFDRRPIYVPNSAFNNIVVENPTRMSHRRISETIGLRYDDIEVMEAVVNDVTDMLKQHPGIDTDESIMVNFNSFARSSLDFFIYCFTRTTDWAEYHQVKQDVLLKIAAIVDANDAEFAFPTSTVKVSEPASSSGSPVAHKAAATPMDNQDAS